MANLRTAAEIEPKGSVSILIYGQPGIGKTTLGCSAPNAVLFDYDGGVNRISPFHQVDTLQVESWEDTARALEALDTDPAFMNKKTIVIDTVGKMLDYMSEYITRQDPKLRTRDGGLALKGYGVRKTMFQQFIRTLAVKGRHVVFIAHEKEEKKGDDTIKRPLVGGSSAADLLQDLDLVGYMQASGRKRVLTFDPSDEYYAKNSCNIPDVEVPACLDAQGLPTSENDFLGRVVFGAFRDNQLRRIELMKKYRAILDDVAEIMADVDSVEALNEAAKVLGSREYIFDAKARALSKLAERAASLGAKYDKTAKAYVCA